MSNEAYKMQGGTFDPWSSVQITSYACSLACNKGDCEFAE